MSELCRLGRAPGGVASRGARPRNGRPVRRRLTRSGPAGVGPALSAPGSKYRPATCLIDGHRIGEDHANKDSTGVEPPPQEGNGRFEVAPGRAKGACVHGIAASNEPANERVLVNGPASELPQFSHETNVECGERRRDGGRPCRTRGRRHASLQPGSLVEISGRQPGPLGCLPAIARSSGRRCSTPPVHTCSIALTRRRPSNSFVTSQRS